MHRRLAGLARRAVRHIGCGSSGRRSRFGAGDDEAGRIESFRRPLQELRGSRGAHQEQGWRRQRVLGAGEQVAVRLFCPDIEGPDIGDANIGQAPNTLARPTRLGRGQRFENRLQIIEDRQNKPATGPEEPLQGTAFGRREQLYKAAIAGEKGREGDAEHGVRRVGFIADRPACPPLDSEPAAVPLDRSIGRPIDSGLWSAAVADPKGRVEKADPLDTYQPLLLSLAIDIRPNCHLVGARLENDGGGQWVASAPPQPYRARIARAGGHVLAQRGGQQQRVAIEPAGTALRLGQRETAGYEVALGKVEFAQHYGVGTAARQHQNGTVVAARDRRGPAPCPILGFYCRERVEVEENFPVWPLAAEAVERSGAPQAARVLGVLPKIEDLGTAPGN